jgi:sugar/nucleoside kinase (ribokinase family)
MESAHTQVKGKVILLVGCCGLDRLLTVSSYPPPDAKVRTTAYNEIGGGNAANTACTMALLCDAHLFKSENFRIKLLTKVGDDHVGEQLKDELQQSGVDVDLVCIGGQGTITSFTTVLVSEAEHTRTCIHTPGTCGELTPADIVSENLEELFANVVHVHSDSRNTDVALMLAREAHQRSIPVSVDVEKDRHTKSLDRLLEIADMVFTNSSQLSDYLDRWTGELEAEHQRRPLAVPVISTIGDNTILLQACAECIFPCHFFQRWYETNPNKRKELIITK